MSNSVVMSIQCNMRKLVMSLLTYLCTENKIKHYEMFCNRKIINSRVVTITSFFLVGSRDTIATLIIFL